MGLVLKNTIGWPVHVSGSAADAGDWPFLGHLRIGHVQQTLLNNNTRRSIANVAGVVPCVSLVKAANIQTGFFAFVYRLTHQPGRIQKKRASCESKVCSFSSKLFSYPLNSLWVRRSDLSYCGLSSRACCEELERSVVRDQK